MIADHEQCVRAVQAKDARFDGRFVTAVVTTGIYCRPSCPARTPAPANMRFYATAAAAQRAGFRACKRCLPDATPGSPQWNARADAVARAVRLIEDGLLDRADVTTLARRVGYSPRHLERLMIDQLGAGPIDLARAQRAHIARGLLERSTLPMSDVAWAAGFASIRSFNDTLKVVYAATPTQLRRRGSSTGTASSDGYAVVPLQLPFRPPLYAAQLFGHLVASAVPGVEEWDGTAYRRTLALPRGHAILALVPPGPEDRAVVGRVWLSDLRDFPTAVHRARWLLDLDADPVAIDATLAADCGLASHVRSHPGRRVPRSVDGRELALRMVLGQHVSTAAARTTAGRIVAAHGEPANDPDGALTRLFPEPHVWADLPDADLPMPQTRRRALRALAVALADGLDVGPSADWADSRAALAGLPGIGAWTIEGIAMRGMGDPDAFPATDLGVLAGARVLGLDSARVLTGHSQRWRPWRSYAVQHLWGLLDHPINQLPPPAEDS